MKYNRRSFLTSMTAGIGALAGILAGVNAREVRGAGETYPYKVFLPTIQKPAPMPVANKVVHVYNSGVTRWKPGMGVNYWDYVNQAIVDQMVESGLQRVTGAATSVDAWKALMSGYTPGKKIAIKVSFNNTYNCNAKTYIEGPINGLIQVVNALVKSLKTNSVEESDVWVYDVNRALPGYFINPPPPLDPSKSGNLYKGVQFFDNASCGSNTKIAAFDSPDPSAVVKFDPAVKNPNNYVMKVTDVLVNASYVINIPLLKPHGGGISLGFKNHFGSINNPALLHPTEFVNGADFAPHYSPLLDLYKNDNIGTKTVLTVGDGLFGSNNYTDPPVAWSIFNNAVPKSLFFSRDPVAIDCVMADFLRKQWPDLNKQWTDTMVDQCYDYLRLAAAAGLGVFEKSDPIAGQYTQISYDRYNQG